MVYYRYIIYWSKEKRFPGNPSFGGKRPYLVHSVTIGVSHDGRARQRSAEPGGGIGTTRQSTDLRQFQEMWEPLFPGKSA